MWYTPDVSYAAGAALLASAAFVHVKFVRHTLPEPPPSTPPRSKDGPTPLMLRPSIAAMVWTLEFLGLNQILEAVARDTGSTVVFQFALAFALLALLMAVASLEWLTRRNFGSAVVGTFVLVVIVGTAVVGIERGEDRFWAHTDARSTWGVAWTGLLLYWNVCLYDARREAFSSGEGFLLRRYGWALLNVSFVLALVYAYTAGIWFGVDDREMSRDAMEHYAFLVDTPSLACTLAGVQALILPFHLRALRAGYVHDLPPMEYGRGPLDFLWRVVRAILLTMLLFGTFWAMRELLEEVTLWFKER